MHRLLVLPFLVLTIATAGSVYAPSKIAGVALLLSSISALACVPLISRRNLVLGYAALLLPFVALALVVVFSPHATGPFDTAKVEVRVDDKGTYYWRAPTEPGSKPDGRAVIIRGSSHAHFGPAVLVHEASPPNKTAGGTPASVTPPAAPEQRH